MEIADRVTVYKPALIDLLEVAIARGETLHGHIESDDSWREWLASLRSMCQTHGPVYRDGDDNMRCVKCLAVVPGV
jgi:hypothetical protein